MATPRMMEPTLLTEIQCTADCLGAISTVINRMVEYMLTYFRFCQEEEDI